MCTNEIKQKSSSSLLVRDSYTALEVTAVVASSIGHISHYYYCATLTSYLLVSLQIFSSRCCRQQQRQVLAALLPE